MTNHAGDSRLLCAQTMPRCAPGMTSPTSRNSIHDPHRRRRLPARDQHLRADQGGLRRLPAWRRLAGDVRKARTCSQAMRGINVGARRLRRARRKLTAGSWCRRSGARATPSAHVTEDAYERVARETARRHRRPRWPARRGLSRPARRDGRRTSRRRRRRNPRARAPGDRQRHAAGRQPRSARQHHAGNGRACRRADRLPHLSACRHGRHRPRLRANIWRCCSTASRNSQRRSGNCRS